MIWPLEIIKGSYRANNKLKSITDVGSICTMLELQSHIRRVCVVAQDMRCAQFKSN